MAPVSPSAIAPAPAAVSNRPFVKADADDGVGNLVERMIPDQWNPTVNPEAKAEFDNVEQKLTYWGIGAEVLRQLSFVPRVIEQSSNGIIALLKLHRFTRATTFFELAERGSGWMRLDPTRLRMLEQEAAHLTPLQAGSLSFVRGLGKLLPWVGPAFAAWDVFKARRESNPARRTVAVGNAALSVVAATLSFANPGAGLVLVLGQCLDSAKGSHFTRWLGGVMQGEWHARGN